MPKAIAHGSDMVQIAIEKNQEAVSEGRVEIVFRVMRNPCRGVIILLPAPQLQICFSLLRSQWLF